MHKFTVGRLALRRLRMLRCGQNWVYRMGRGAGGLPPLTCAVLFLAGMAWPAPDAAAQPAKPNVVIILSDDGGYADWGFQDQFTGQTTQFKTPHLDQLAQQSVVFSNAYTSASVCSPSRAGLLTGRYQQKLGFEQNIAHVESELSGLPTTAFTIAERVKQLGYTTGMVGKWHLGETPSMHPNQQGFDEFFGILRGNREYWNHPTTSAMYRNGSVDTSWASEASFNQTPNDPVLGRFVTDAFGDEASKFIANHADDANPFLLYLPFTAPHNPIHGVKRTDAAQFASSTLSDNRKNIAALTYNLDYNIGQVLDRLDDPNRDGDTSDSIRDNTIVVFLNDNGGEKPNSITGELHYNGDLLGYKGSHWEGGLRVPYMIRAPGIAPGVVDEMVSSLDLFPTIVAAAGGALTTPTDGVNLLPHLSGAQQGPIHDALFWRIGVDGFAIRKGDWKLVKGTGNIPVQLHHLNPDGTGEDVDLAAENPEKFQELLRDFVGWEATIDKTKWTTAVTLNRNDEFVQRNDLSTTFNWRTTAGWVDNQSPGSDPVTLRRYDSSANAVFIFETRNEASYSSRANLGRAVSHGELAPVPTPAGLSEWMLNEVRFRGNFNAAVDRSATLFENALLLVNNLSGRQARITLDANEIGTGKYTFNINMDLVLFHDTLLTGNGTAKLNIGGVIRDFYTPRSIIKEGASKVTFSGHNTYAGRTIIRGGELSLTTTGAIDGSSRVHVQNGGTLNLAAGLIQTPRLSIDAGGVFTFSGGQLATNQVDGSVVNTGGRFEPGLTQGVTNVFGGFSQTAAGTLQMLIEATPQSTNVDKLAVSNQAALGGVLDIDILNSGGSVALNVHSYDLITAANITGTFSSVMLPAAPNAYTAWAVAYASNKVTLNLSLLPGVIYSAADGINQRDLVTLLYNFGKLSGATLAQGDANGDGAVNGADLITWQRSLAAATPTGAAVPEPGSCALCLGALAALLARRRRERRAA
jgi:autotransporter-associated beta strand protein